LRIVVEPFLENPEPVVTRVLAGADRVAVGPASLVLPAVPAARAGRRYGPDLRR
jgi:hypothetical protein